MAKRVVEVPEVKLTEEQKAQLKQLEEPLRKVREQVELLRSAGIDVSLAEEKLTKAEKLREILLRHF